MSVVRVGGDEGGESLATVWAINMLQNGGTIWYREVAEPEDMNMCSDAFCTSYSVAVKLQNSDGDQCRCNCCYKFPVVPKYLQNERGKKGKRKYA